MRYPIAIEPGTDETSHGVVVPDLPGCFSAGDTIDDAIDNAAEAILVWCEAAVENGEAVPSATSVTAHAKKREFKGWTWAVVDVPVEQLMGPAERVNITLPQRVLAAIDHQAKAGGETRSGFIARVAMSAIVDRRPVASAGRVLQEPRAGYSASRRKTPKSRK
jgi:predicted RNase H-like HicB family nuclease